MYYEIYVNDVIFQEYAVFLMFFSSPYPQVRISGKPVIGFLLGNYQMFNV